jgi:hypothetical protein
MEIVDVAIRKEIFMQFASNFSSPLILAKFFSDADKDEGKMFNG